MKKSRIDRFERNDSENDGFAESEKRKRREGRRRSEHRERRKNKEFQDDN